MSQPENELRAAAQAVIEWENEYRTLNNLGKYPPHVFIWLAAALASPAPATTPRPLSESVKEDVELLVSAVREFEKHSYISGDPIGGCGECLRLFDRLIAQANAIEIAFAQAAAPGPRCSHGVLMREFCQGCEDAGQSAAPAEKESLGKVSFQLLTEKDVAEAYQAAPDWFTVLSALECRGKEPPRDEPDFGSAEEVIAGLDRINEHNRQVAAQDKPTPGETR